MCLARLKDFAPPKNGIGYQVKRKHKYYKNAWSRSTWDKPNRVEYGALFRNEFSTENCSGDLFRILRKNRWYTSSKRKIFAGHSWEHGTAYFYDSGFHIYTSKAAAMRAYKRTRFGKVIVKVKFKDVKATGYQDGEKVIVARQMKIEEEVYP